MDAPLYDDFTKVLKKAEFSRVYRPNDDSYFFVKTILADMEAFKEAQVIVEVGASNDVFDRLRFGVCDR
jgi:hypothetical protein